ncbi:winged helix-turn-helix domain-containing protein [Actinokineospora inagensis]|uniref:winged helix-turn-helix domain-containing protein n=1 Tax=Actinokineospora inagensis TaxID=103730 RepID=UPI000405F571|nr:helix-turn-helix domain-containing protein [Actinokineospora inagensis]
MTDEPESKRLDVGGLRALAHPLRLRLLELLRLDGPATATRLAERVGGNTGNISWHLRQLAAAGFIEDHEERGTKRERWWRACHQYTSVHDADFPADPEIRSSLFTLMTQNLARQMRRAEEFLQEDWDEAWRAAAAMGHWVLRLDPDALLALGHEITAVLERHEALSREAPREPGVEDVIFQLQVFPRRRADEA